MSGAPGPRRLALGERDRFVVTIDRTAPVAHLVDALLVAHGRGERAARAAVAWLPVRAQARLLLRRWELRLDDAGRVEVEQAPAAPAAPPGGAAERLAGSVALLLAALEAGGGELAARLHLDARRPPSWILLADYAGGGRRGGVAFLFDGGPRPRAVVKLRRRGSGAPCLAREWEALHALRERLPPALQASVPSPLLHREQGEIELLATGWLPGRSAYVELQTVLLPGRLAASHLRRAADWLAAFQRATGAAAQGLPEIAAEGEELLSRVPAAWDGDAARGRSWLDSLGAVRALPALARSAAHGDFWARNLLVGDRAASVVDWDGFRAADSPHRDLFHFALTYALAFPWGARYRRLAPGAALQRAFVDDNAVSRLVSRYLARWCALCGAPLAALEPLLHLELLRRAAAGGAPRRGDLRAVSDRRGDLRAVPDQWPGAQSVPPTAGRAPAEDPWIELHRRLATADRSVFSG